jgi:hypothetical protein
MYSTAVVCGQRVHSRAPAQLKRLYALWLALRAELLPTPMLLLAAQPVSVH